MNYLAATDDSFAERGTDAALNIGMFVLTAVGGLLGMCIIIGAVYAYMNITEAADRAKQRRAQSQLQRDNQLRLERLAARGIPARGATHHRKTDYNANKETLK